MSMGYKRCLSFFLSWLTFLAGVLYTIISYYELSGTGVGVDILLNHCKFLIHFIIYDVNFIESD